jgi:regulator of protease activity HflC (stomatin/prohibitin superfamily)
MREPESNAPLHGLNKGLSQAGLFLLFFGYWFFVRQLEQVDLTLTTWAWVKTIVDALTLLPFSDFAIWVAEFFTWRVLRHLIPFFVGWWLARKAILGMLQSFYDLEDETAADTLLYRLSASRIGFARPTLVSLDTFEEAREKVPLLKIGGPGRIVVMSGAVLVTELHGRFNRILGPGRHVLSRFEVPRTLLDLRPHEREADNIKMMTSDGIEISTSLTITFQILRGDEKPTRGNPFPYDEKAVREAAYTETNQPDGSVALWDSLPMLITGAQLRAIVAEDRLDDLIVSESNGIDVHHRLQMEMERRAKAIMRNYGVLIRGTRLGALELPEEVENQRKKFWQVHWNSRQILQKADGDAEVLQSHEIARAEAEAIMLQAIAEGLQRSQRAGRVVSSREVVALRLIESLEAMAKSSERVLPLPDRLMSQLGSLRQQLMLTSGKPEETKNQE